MFRAIATFTPCERPGVTFKRIAIDVNTEAEWWGSTEGVVRASNIWGEGIGCNGNSLFFEGDKKQVARTDVERRIGFCAWEDIQLEND